MRTVKRRFKRVIFGPSPAGLTIPGRGPCGSEIDLVSGGREPSKNSARRGRFIRAGAGAASKKKSEARRVRGEVRNPRSEAGRIEGEMFMERNLLGLLDSSSTTATAAGDTHGSGSRYNHARADVRPEMMAALMSAAWRDDDLRRPHQVVAVGSIDTPPSSFRDHHHQQQLVQVCDLISMAVERPVSPDGSQLGSYVNFRASCSRCLHSRGMMIELCVACRRKMREVYY